jgi:dethiobiotin synthetase
MTRPQRLVVVVGTATEVGKTWCSARLLAAGRAKGWRVAARKPVQSFDPADPAPTDADVLASATGEEPLVVCPAHRWLGVPLAPPMAAAVLNLAGFGIADLVAEIAWPAGISLALGLVETVGGLRSPIADDADSLDLARLLQPDLVILVADAGLGTINSVRLCTDALSPLPTVVVLNRFDSDNDLHRRNLAWLRDIDGLSVVAGPDAERDLLDRISGR